MKNNKGMGRTELITVLAFILVIIAVCLGIFFNAHSKHKYNMFVKNANNLSSILSQFRDAYPVYGDTIYLKDAIDENATKEIANPFSSEKYCDSYETKLEIINDNRYLTFKCGDYVIYKHQPGTGVYQIYKVGSWSEKIPETSVESMFVYNYYNDNGFLVFNEYLQLPEFLENYNENEGTNIYKLSDITSNNVVAKSVYRSRSLVKEIS